MSAEGNATGPEAPPDPLAPLLRRWQDEGDPDALDALLREEVATLKRRLHARVGNVPDPAVSVSDLAQQAVVKLLAVEPAPRFDDPRALRAYLWTSAWRLLLDKLRRNGRTPARVDVSSTSQLDAHLATDGASSTLDRRERSVALEVALNLLKPAEREILELVYFRSLDIEGAARELGIARDAANMRLVRARRALGARLAAWSGVIG